MALNKAGYIVPDGIAADAIIIQKRVNAQGSLSVHALLVTRKKDPYAGKLAFAGGFLNPYELGLDACIREVAEEAHLHIASYIKPNPILVRSGRGLMDPRGWIIAMAYLAILPEDREFEPRPDDDAEAIAWYDIIDVLDTHMAFDHYLILKSALNLILY